MTMLLPIFDIALWDKFDEKHSEKKRFRLKNKMKD